MFTLVNTATVEPCSTVEVSPRREATKCCFSETCVAMWVLRVESTFIFLTKRLLARLRVNLTHNHVTKRALNPLTRNINSYRPQCTTDLDRWNCGLDWEPIFTSNYSFETQPGSWPGLIIRSRVRWVDPGQPGLNKKKKAKNKKKKTKERWHLSIYETN